MNKVKNENYYKELEKRDTGVKSINSTYKHKCGNCKNDIVLPCTFCKFCGYRVL